MCQTIISETRSKTPNHAICQPAQSSDMPICMFCEVLQGSLQFYTLLVHSPRTSVPFYCCLFTVFMSQTGSNNLQELLLLAKIHPQAF